MGGAIDPIELAQREEARHARAMAELADSSEVLADGVMAWSEAGAWTNRACGQGWHGEVPSEVWLQARAHYEALELDHDVQVAMHADSSVMKGLHAAGYACTSVMGVHVIELASRAAEVVRAHASPPELAIEQVDVEDEVALDRFCELSVRGFSRDGEEPGELALRLIRRVARHPRSRVFVASWAGEPCGATGMECAPEIACLFGSSVLPEYRRRGVQAAMVATRLREASAAGCPHAFMHAPPGHTSERQAGRAGMQLCYAKLVFEPSSALSAVS